ncbi:DNA-processing protein DprA [Gluconobacter sphaericus]|uniref:DNA processing protein DprA n=1 Tax=Gluconobacter sphaericus NBRC 12467 TaxID=1307951 RepID=A0AA37WAT9_9PROT|nr:DNA-processing protein DprA [Gluconobacter sphaericus]MBF0885995.1 DNA-protecting protein DprA [Gluconobacter sphaericus]MBS1086157.1 DNA-protecting protein DprA [Gluconobacter sphaericus]MBS1100094.1 DNA-protecting protein DprA [Gluconobacter sphaericus]QQX90023.1 DNA-protecting protein DprA [Gluconobacter sphaericus]GBR49861.1 DNA processing protein DprA [Gluconobacter sphaericus NBRC 12467]
MTASPDMRPVLPAADRIDILRLARTTGVGPINFARLMTQYGSAGTALAALPDRMRQAGRREDPVIPTVSRMSDELERLEKLGGKMLVRGDADYPLLLSCIPDAPPVLFTLGDIRKLSMRSVGIVGARNASAAGIRMAESLSAEIAHSGLCVISGLARGIDSASHAAALHTGLTVAAIAGGLDHVYPHENASLQQQIAERGCLVTEALLGTAPQARHFPRRNRLIAGISLGCLIIEATIGSGTLITADLAQSYNRELLVVPGSPLDPRSRGGNQLLKTGQATLTENIVDILQALPSALPPREAAPWQRSSAHSPPLTGFSEPSIAWGNPVSENWVEPDLAQKTVCSLLSVTPVAVDEVVRRCQFSVSVVLATLAELELGGVVEFVPGGRVALLPN